MQVTNITMMVVMVLLKPLTNQNIIHHENTNSLLTHPNNNH